MRETESRRARRSPRRVASRVGARGASRAGAVRDSGGTLATGGDAAAACRCVRGRDAVRVWAPPDLVLREPRSVGDLGCRLRTSRVSELAAAVDAATRPAEGEMAAHVPRVPVAPPLAVERPRARALHSGRADRRGHTFGDPRGALTQIGLNGDAATQSSGGAVDASRLSSSDERTPRVSRGAAGCRSPSGRRIRSGSDPGGFLRVTSLPAPTRTRPADGTRRVEDPRDRRPVRPRADRPAAAGLAGCDRLARSALGARVGRRAAAASRWSIVGETAPDESRIRETRGSARPRPPRAIFELQCASKWRKK